jgi:hypothetical protein
MKNERRDYSQLLEELKLTVAEQIKVTVNGKIDRIDAKIDNIHTRLDDQDKILVELKPVRDGLTAWSFVSGLVKGISAVIIAIGVILGVFKLMFPVGSYTFNKTSDAETIQKAVNKALDNKEFNITK